jgi:hypothetical protein
MADGAGGAWTFGGSILTATFPMILFIVVAVALYVLYTKPEFTPGHRAPRLERPVSYTAVPGLPTGHPATTAAAGHLASARPAAAGTTSNVPVATAGPAAGPAEASVAGTSGTATAGTTGTVAETPAAETPVAETGAADTPAAETPAADTPAAETSPGPAAETEGAE